MDQLISKDNVKKLCINKTHKEDFEKSLFNTAVDICFTQVPASKGIKEYGEQEIAAMIKEFKQLLNGAMPGKLVIQGICHGSLSYEDKKKALDAVNLIKIKRDGK